MTWVTPLPRTRYGRLLLLAAVAVGLLACGESPRDNPLDPDGTVVPGIRLIASLPAAVTADLSDRLATFRYRVTGPDSAVLASGEMNRVGSRVEAVVQGISSGPERIFSVHALDAQGIRTFAGTLTVAAGTELPATVTVPLQRLHGDLEVAASLPPEVDTLTVIVGADADSITRVFTRAQATSVRIAAVPTGADVQVRVLGRSHDGYLVVERVVLLDIREDLLARLNLAVEVGAIEVTARFPEYLPIAVVDRFSDAAGRFFRRSEDGGLPAPGEPIDFDQARFLHRGLGPNGERVVFYHFDARPAQPPPVYLVVDRRGNRVAGQLPIFDLLPGEEGHSDLWQVHEVQVVDPLYKANALSSRQAILDGGYPVTATEELMNCVMVPPGSRAARRFDPATPVSPQDGWHQGQIVKYLLFEHPASTARAAFGGGVLVPQQMYAFLADDVGLSGGFARDEAGLTHNVVAALPGQGEQGDYTPLWLVRVLRLTAFDRVTNLATAGDQIAENLNPAFTDLTINAPIVAVE